MLASHACDVSFDEYSGYKGVHVLIGLNNMYFLFYIYYKGKLIYATKYGNLICKAHNSAVIIARMHIPIIDK